MLERFYEVREQLNKVSPTFCLAKWLQSTIHLQNGEVSSCCKAPPHVVSPSEVKSAPQALHNSRELKNQREALKNGKQDKSCSYCWQIENLKDNSISDRPRLSSSPWAIKHIDEVKQNSYKEDIAPTYLEVSFSHVCNFKCSYCQPTKSSRWLDEIKREGPYLTSWNYNNLDYFKRMGAMPIENEAQNPYLQAFWKWWPEIFPRLHTFRITGGEPFLSGDLIKVLDYIEKNPNPELTFSINTNLGVSLVRTQNIIAQIGRLLDKNCIKNFILHTSIDTWGERAEYIRHGLNAEEFWQRLRFVLETLPRARVNIMSTFNALSIFGYEQLLHKVLELKREFNSPLRESGSAVILDVNHLDYPHHQSVQILTPDFQPHVQNLIDLMEQNRALRSGDPGFFDFETLKMKRVLEIMRAPKNESWLKQFRNDFHIFFSEHDRRRQTNFLRVFPEMAEFWQFCQT